MMRNCEQCGKEFNYPTWANWPGRFCSRGCLYESMRLYPPTNCLTCGNIVRKKKYCLRSCYAKSLVGKRPPRVIEKGSIPWNKGKVSTQADENHPHWRGDGVGYAALHSWVRRKLGRPNRCDHCGISEGKFQWSNISREYRRDLNDWQRLCQSCHGNYDRAARIVEKALVSVIMGY